MCDYKTIESIVLSNGKKVKEVNNEVRKEIESIYLDSWRKGISVPFWDNDGNLFLANSDGSEDMVSLDTKNRTYQILRRVAQPGEGKYSYLTKVSHP